MTHSIARNLSVLMLAAAASTQTDGKPAPAIHFVRTFHFEGIKDKELADLQGSAVLVEFWGTH